MTQEFFKQYDESKRMIKALNEDLLTRDSLARQGQNTIKINQVLHQQLNQLFKQVNILQSSVSQTENDQGNIITKPELDRRRKMAFEIQNQFDNLNKKVDSIRSSGISAQLFTPSTQKSYKDSRDVNNISVDMLKEDKLTFDIEFDKKVGQLSDASYNLRREQDGMKNELDYQNQYLLPGLEDKIDQNNIRLMKNNSKLNRILQKGSDCKLWLCLLIELLLLILLLIN